MSDSNRTRELRDNFRTSWDSAFRTLESERCTKELLELYEHELVSSTEVMATVWRAFHDDDEALAIVCAQFRRHADESIRRIADDIVELDRQQTESDR